MQLADVKLDLTVKLDNDLFQHITYVSNQILIGFRDNGWNEETRIKAGKMLWRLFNVVQAYNAKRRELTLSSVLEIIDDFHKVFTGA
jgi:hypothetical protein